MTTEHSTYTYEGGAQETVTLARGPITPHGHALLKINYSDGRAADCYVNTAWLRDRAEQLVQQRPEGAEDIERVLRDYGINDGEQDFADFLAQRGVRVVTKETSR